MSIKNNFDRFTFFEYVSTEDNSEGHRNGVQRELSPHLQEKIPVKPPLERRDHALRLSPVVSIGKAIANNAAYRPITTGTTGILKDQLLV
ncbi:MAG: hypothetical protein JSU83_10160 [Deltaproteobacteria bacterium]|nr:MAG: hypothetical protein JSU83_10160 [Deltaproteobacteria bacterium]